MAVGESWQPSSSPVWGDHFTHRERGCVRICHHYVNTEVAILPRNHISELGRGYGTERFFQVKCISSFLQGQIRFCMCLWFNLIEMVIFELILGQVSFLVVAPAISKQDLTSEGAKIKWQTTKPQKNSLTFWKYISELREYFPGSFVLMVILDRKAPGGQTLCLIHLLSSEPSMTFPQMW